MTDKPTKVYVSVVMEDTVRDACRRLARDEGRSVSNLIAQTVREALEQRKYLEPRPLLEIQS
jgi:hypothetical protein